MVSAILLVRRKTVLWTSVTCTVRWPFRPDSRPPDGGKVGGLGRDAGGDAGVLTTWLPGRGSDLMLPGTRRGSFSVHPGERKSDPWRGSARVSWAGCAARRASSQCGFRTTCPSSPHKPGVCEPRSSAGDVSRTVCTVTEIFALSSEKIRLGVSGVGQGRSGRQLSSDTGYAEEVCLFPGFPWGLPSLQ